MALQQGTGEVEVGAPAGRRRPSSFAILILAVLSLLCAPLFVDVIDHDAPQAKGGVVDFSTAGPLTSPVNLAGEWRFTWNVPPKAGATMLVKVPGPWKGPHAGGPTLPGRGAASYELVIRGLRPGGYVLHMPPLYSATRVLVNGRVAAERGQVGATAETTQYGVRGANIPIVTDGSDIHLRIDVATFLHHDNGLGGAPKLGLADAMNRWIMLDSTRSVLVLTSLMLLGAFGAVVFLYRRRERSSLFMALGCAFFLPQVALNSHDNLISLVAPAIGFGPILLVQYLASAAAIGFVLAYVDALFPRESPRWLYRILQALNTARFVAYAAVGATGDTFLLSEVSQWSILLRTAIFLYILAVVIAAWRRRRDGALVFMVGLGLFIVTLIYTDLTSNASVPRTLPFDILPIGMLLLLYAQIIILAERWSLAIGEVEQTNADLRRLLDINISISSEMRLEALLTKIVKVTSKVIHADRASLFLHDARTNELWSVVAEGVEARPIRIAADVGLAGWCFTHGESLNLADAYADPRFNRAVDAETGYRTQSVLTAPVITRDGRRIGVMQALNHEGATAFGQGDAERMNAFAAQAAIAIDNARLFSEVASERNYNESILRSMSSGVVTLDDELSVAKLNTAAARILELPEDLAAGADARDWMAENNPLLLLEVEGVLESGRPKTLLDADIRTGTGGTISANVSIVPLISDGERVGLLILIEDITEGKRLQGAMRRFMTQAVVEQVMDHDELMFGAACRASALFADIRNFTTLAETLSPRETVDMLNEIFTELFEAVASHQGMLDKFLGDAVMAVYGAPIPTGRDPLNAVNSATAMVRAMDRLNRRGVAPGGEQLRLGVGIATGEMVAGTIGSPKRMDYTVIGDAVNLAARLQQVTKLYRVDVVVCEDTAAAVKGKVELRELDTIRVRGRKRAAKIFQVLTEEIDERGLDAYRRGRDLLELRRWREAAAAFEYAAHVSPDDRPSEIMLERARILAARPPAADWDGVWDQAEAA
jgi:adenylate cyclase